MKEEVNVYSFGSQMPAMIGTNGQVFTYAFDGDGNRIGQSINDCLSTRYVYDGPNVVLELNASNEVTHAVVNGPGIDQPVERIAYVKGEPRLRQVYHTDGLGSVAMMTDEAQAPVKTYAYDAFGRIQSEAGELVMNRLTYTGREALGDSEGLYYYRWRVMDPNTGRFTSEDPLGFVDGPNRYRYCANNPVSYLDPDGTMASRPPSPVNPLKPEDPAVLIACLNCAKYRRLEDNCEIDNMFRERDCKKQKDCSEFTRKRKHWCDRCQRMGRVKFPDKKQ